jgi:hypothetical protein
VLDKVLDCLRKVWYESQSCDVLTVKLWANPGEHEDEQERMESFPPYRLTSFQQARILHALEHMKFLCVDLVGRDLLRPWTDWVKDQKAVVDWVRKGPEGLHHFDKPWPVRVTPVHGDLNRTNILFWIQERRPFFIDFTTYQERAHPLQDLAELEAEIRFFLMDRELDSDLPAFDHTHTQFEPWCEAERAFASPDWERHPPIAASVSKGIDKAYRLVAKIRNAAAHIHGLSKVPQSERCPFFVEYATALLYHTLRVIGYDGLSPFKHLLAGYSAARQIEYLKKSAEQGA